MIDPLLEEHLKAYRADLIKWCRSDAGDTYLSRVAAKLERELTFSDINALLDAMVEDIGFLATEAPHVMEAFVRWGIADGQVLLEIATTHNERHRLLGAAPANRCPKHQLRIEAGLLMTTNEKHLVRCIPLVDNVPFDKCNYETRREDIPPDMTPRQKLLLSRVRQILVESGLDRPTDTEMRNSGEQFRQYTRQRGDSPKAIEKAVRTYGKFTQRVYDRVAAYVLHELVKRGIPQEDALFIGLEVGYAWADREWLSLALCVNLR